MLYRSQSYLTTALPFTLLTFLTLLTIAWHSVAQDENSLTAVTVAEAKMTDVTPITTFTGRVEAVNDVKLRTRISGFLEQRLFKEGDSVKKGDLLFVIEQDEYQAQVEFVTGSIQRLKGTLNLALIEKRRSEGLLRQRAGSQEALDEANALVAETEGDLTSQKASLRQAELDLSYTEIKAPFDGRVGYSPFSQGDFVTPQSEPLALIVSQDPMYVTFPVSQRELLEFRLKAQSQGIDVSQLRIRIKLPNGELYQPVGVLDAIDVEADPGTDTILIRAKFPNPQGLLIPRQLIGVQIEEQVRQQLTIPLTAMQLDQGGAFVLLVDEQNQVQVQRIERGMTTGGRIVVTSGLQPGQRVITIGVQKVRPGMQVNPTLATDTVNEG